jgi:hypothetical protein
MSASLTVSFSLGGTAVENRDYILLDPTAHFDPGSATAFVGILPRNASNPEPTTTVTLTVLSGSGYTVGSTSAATVTITDMDVPQLPGLFVPSQYPALSADITYFQTAISNGQLLLKVSLPGGTSVATGALVEFFLDTDQNPRTGNNGVGYMGGFEYHIEAQAKAIVGGAELFLEPTNQNGLQAEKDLGPIMSWSVNGPYFFLSVPLAAIGNPSDANVVAEAHEPDASTRLQGSGARAPLYGAMDAAQDAVVAPDPAPTRITNPIDPAGDTTGPGYDLIGAVFTTIADQFEIAIAFAQPFDPTQIGITGPRGQVVMDSDQNILTGGLEVGNPIPTWGADQRLFFQRPERELETRRFAITPLQVGQE